MKEKEFDLLDIILALLKQKKRLIIHFFFIAIISVIYSLFLTKIYKSSIVFLPPNPGSSSGLSALMQNFSIDILGSNDISKRQITTLLHSRDIREQLIKKFDLIQVYKTHKSPNFLERALKVLDKNIVIAIDEEGGLGFSDITSFSVAVYDKKPQRAKEMVDFFIKQIDKKIQGMNTERAKANRDFIYTKMVELKDSLSLARERLNSFQMENKIFNPSEQIKMVLTSIAQMKAEMMALETQKNYLLTQQHYNHPDIKQLDLRIRVIGNEIKQIETTKKRDLMIGLESSLELMGTYSDLLIEFESLQGVNALLKQQYEQAKIQETKDVPSLRIVDHAKVAQWKAKPKRANIVIVITGIYMVVLVCILLMREYSEKQRTVNPQSFEKVDRIIEEIRFWRKSRN